MYIAVVVIIYHIKENEGDLESAQKIKVGGKESENLECQIIRQWGIIEVGGS